MCLNCNNNITQIYSEKQDWGKCNNKQFSSYAFIDALTLALSTSKVSHKNFIQHIEAGLQTVSLPLVFEAGINAGKVVNAEKTLPGHNSDQERQEGQGSGHSFKDTKKYLTLKKGHKYFHDCERETWARLIDWAFKNYAPKDVWFFTGTYRYCYQTDKRPNEIFNKFILRLEQALITLGVNGAEYSNGYMTDSKSQSCKCDHKQSSVARLYKAGGSLLRYVKADELQIRGAIHHHAIIAGKGLSLLSHRHWEEKWVRLAGIARIGEYIKRSAPYLAKYVSKGSQMSIGGNWQGLHIPNWIYCCDRSCSSGAIALNSGMQEEEYIHDGSLMSDERSLQA